MLQRLGPDNANHRSATGSRRTPHPIALMRRHTDADLPARAADLFHATTRQPTTKIVTM
jgi:hypothetical protein